MEFTPEQKVLNDLFGNDLTYVIPSYQRPYSWSSKGKSDKDNQVNTMWTDLMDHFESESQNIYFMGSMVLIGDSSSRTYQVVDGQQRLTTLTLLFVAIKCMLQGLDDTIIEQTNRAELKGFISNALSNINSILFNKKLFGVVEQEKKVRIQRSTGFDYDKILKDALECADFSAIHYSDMNEEQKMVSERYFANRDFFKNKLLDEFLDNGIFTLERAKRINEFIEFLKNKVTIVRILSPRFDVAYQIFEILNNRGLPLSNKDLFRNFMISKLYESEISEPEKKWRKLEDYEFSSDFIGRYVESKKASKQKHSAFNDLQELYKSKFTDSMQKKKIEYFYEDIEDNLRCFSQIELLTYSNKQIKHRVDFLKNCGNSRYIFNLLLALFNNIRKEAELIDFLTELELFVLYLLLGPSKRFQVSPIFDSIEQLNIGKFDGAIAFISLTSIEKSELKRLIIEEEIKDNDWAKLLIARYLWAIDMDNPDDVVDFSLNYKSATLEHIIPQSPDNPSNWTTDFKPDFRKKYTYKLGNMTLLTQRMNSSAKNYEFLRKREIYKKMKLPMTVQIGNLDSINEDFISKRHREISQYLVNHLDLQ